MRKRSETLGMNRRDDVFFGRGSLAGFPMQNEGGSPRPELAVSEQVNRGTLLGDKAADLLRRKILNGELPHGTRLVEDILAKQIGTSRGPLRYAFQLLAREGLVTITQGKGTYVAGLSRESVEQLYDVRLVLETRAVELATENIGEEGAPELQILVDRMVEAERNHQAADLVDADVNIHRTIWALSRNYHLIRVLEYMIGPCITLMTMSLTDWDEWHRIVEGHVEVVTAIVSGDKVAAVRGLQRTFAALPQGPFPPSHI